MGLPPIWNWQSKTRRDSELGLQPCYERPRQLQDFLLRSSGFYFARRMRAEIFSFPPVKTTLAK